MSIYVCLVTLTETVGTPTLTAPGQHPVRSAESEPAARQWPAAYRIMPGSGWIMLSMSYAWSMDFPSTLNWNMELATR